MPRLTLQQTRMRRTSRIMSARVHPESIAIPSGRRKRKQERDHHTYKKRHRLHHRRAQVLEVTA